MEKTKDDVVISVRNLKTYFYSNQRCNPAVNGVSFDIRRGKTLCMVGESGCGKSVTASSIMQLLPELSRIESGQIIYRTGDERGDIEIQKLAKNGRQMRALRAKDIAMIFQDPLTALNPVYKVGNQIVECMREHLREMSRKDAREKTVGLLGYMGIPEPKKRVEQYPHEYSGGMRQRAMIAMGMSCAPKVLLADEPTTALDVTIQAQIFDLMNVLKADNDTAILLITHDMGVVSELADDVCVMYMGNIVESGTAREVLKTPQHPYTKALLASIPILGRGKNQNLQPIRGATPDPYKRPKGCQFAPRCDFCSTRCNAEMPGESLLEGTHKVCCHLFSDGAKNADAANSAESEKNAKSEGGEK